MLCPALISHAASSGFFASPNPIAAVSAARAAGKGLLSDDSNFSRQVCNLVCRELIGYCGIISRGNVYTEQH